MTRALACCLLFAAACDAQLEANMVQEIPGENITYGAGNVLALRGPAGQILELNGSGPKTLQWAPLDRRACDLEFRAFIVDYSPVPGSPSVPPLVRWSAKYGHGKNTYNSPMYAPQALASGAQVFVQNVLPARGLALRMNAREWEFQVFSPSKVDNTDAYPVTKVAISIEPTYGAVDVATVPRQHYSATAPAPGGALPLEPFPPEANEFRIFDEQGQPYAPGSGLITFFDMGGQLIAAPSVDIATYGTFQPIPVHAIAWGPPFQPHGAPWSCSAEYR